MYEGDDSRRALATFRPERLSDEEVIATLLRLNCSAETSLKISGELVGLLGGIEGLADISYSELTSIRGVGPAVASALLASLELGKRAISGAAPGIRLSSSMDVYNAFWPLMANEKAEVFCCAMLDARLRLIGAEEVSRGTLTASIVHPREAFRKAVRNAASSVVFVHNHPSGDPLPSDEDYRITCRLEEVGHIIGIPLVDHLIVGSRGSYFSFADAGELEPQSRGYRGMVLK